MPRHVIAALATLAALLLAGPAAAQPGKAPRDDRDRDGLTDRQERLLGTDPAKADSDGDGTKDGNEGGGRVVARRGGRLVIAMFGGGSVRAKLTDATDVLCPEPGDEDAEEDVPLEAEDAPAEDAPEADPPVDLPADLQSLPGTEDEPADAEPEDEELGCDADDLELGAVVTETDTAGKGRRRRWTRIVLAG